MSAPSFARLLAPRSVAIVGASEKPGALGASLLANLTANGFSGDIHLINPKRAEIGGRPCLPGIAALPDSVDVAVLAIPRAGVLDAVRALAARGVGGAIVFSAGFAEGGEAGLAEQAEIARIADGAGMALLGPNCLGLVNHVTAAPLTFVETRVTPPPAGVPGIGIVSQSGAMACVLGTTLQSRELPLTLSVSTGNEAGSGVEDYVEHLVADPATRVIAMIVEHFRVPRRFLAAARAAADAGKTIVLLHPGRSQAARESAATHTGALAGDHAVMRLLVGEAGVVVAESLEELGDVAEIALRCPVRSGGGLAILGESGAFKALMLDLADQIGIGLVPLDAANAPALRAALPDFVGVSNPLDITAQGLVDPDLYTRTLGALLADERVGVVLAGIIQTDVTTTAIKVPPILAAARCADGGKPLIFAGLDEGASIPATDVAALRTLGIPYFPSSERALRAIARLGGRREPASSVASGDGRIELPPGGGVVAEYRAKEMLRATGIAFPPGRLARTAADAREAADALGYPVALKAQSAALPHKSDAGGVAIGLADGEAVEAAWDRIMADVVRHKPGLELDGLLVESMGAGGLELIVGARRDADWGPVVLVGLGGVLAEALQDVRLIAPDATPARIEEELRRLRGATLFDGWRGSPPLDVAAAVDLVARIGAAMTANPRIVEIDLNPVTLRADGVTALDALMLLAPVR